MYTKEQLNDLYERVVKTIDISDKMFDEIRLTFMRKVLLRLALLSSLLKIQKIMILIWSVNWRINTGFQPKN